MKTFRFDNQQQFRALRNIINRTLPDPKSLTGFLLILQNKLYDKRSFDIAYIVANFTYGAVK